MKNIDISNQLYDLCRLGYYKLYLTIPTEILAMSASVTWLPTYKCSL